MLVFAFESLLRCCIALRVTFLRVLFVELMRCFNGLLCVSCMMFDMGALCPLLWSFEERDKMMVVFDFVCGCRMHLAFFCLCGVLDDFSFGVVDFLLFLCLSCMFLLDVFDLFVLNNRICLLSFARDMFV